MLLSELEQNGYFNVCCIVVLLGPFEGMSDQLSTFIGKVLGTLFHTITKICKILVTCKYDVAIKFKFEPLHFVNS